MTKKRPVSLRYNLGVFPQGQHTEAVIQRAPRLHVSMAADLVMCNLPSSADVGSMDARI